LPSPSASIPHIFHVAGMNWVQPIAPADDGPMLQPWPDSISVIAASTLARSPNARAAVFHVWTSCRGPRQRGSGLSPDRMVGLPPRRKFERAASGASLRALNVLIARLFLKANVSTHRAGFPRPVRACLHDRCRWWPRPCPLSPL
jgi:hypothetical protein